MPFTRVLAAVFLVITLLMAAGGAIFRTTPHPVLTVEAIWMTVALALVLFGMAMAREFFLDVVVVMYCAFFTQRILVVYAFPSELDFQDHLGIFSETVTVAVAFTLASAIATWVGFTIGSRGGAPDRARADAIDSLTIFGRPMPFEGIFKWYAAFAIPLAVYQLMLRVTEGAGVGGLAFDRAYAVVFRISFIPDALGFLAVMMLLKRDGRRGLRRAAAVLLALQVLLMFTHTSKGALLVVLAIVITCAHFMGRPVGPRAVVIGGAALVLTPLVLFPVMTATRTVAESVFLGLGSWNDVFGEFAHLEQAETLMRSVLEFSRRLEGFDLLAGFIAIGRDAFPSWVSLNGELVTVLNSLVPGDVIDMSDWTPINALIPMMLRGVVSIEAVGGNRDVEGITGMAYLHYGPLLGPVFFFAWSFVSARVLGAGRNPNVIVKVLYFSVFVVVLFTSGGLATVVSRFYEGLICLFGAAALHLFASHRSTGRQAMSRPVTMPRTSALVARRGTDSGSLD